MQTLILKRDGELKERLEDLYRMYNMRSLVHPDPLEFLYHYPGLQDREIVGLLASSLAYGRVARILYAVSSVLKVMGPSPYLYIARSRESEIQKDFAGFSHRFAKEGNMVSLLMGIKGCIKRFGSLKRCFLTGVCRDEKDYVNALKRFVDSLKRSGAETAGHLLPDPAKKSACKRLHLFLRWMVRQDDVDPGGWEPLLPEKLLVPIDVHMHRICLQLGLTGRRQADLVTAREVTCAFKAFSPKDPVKYDFALTRSGIWKNWRS